MYYMQLGQSAFNEGRIVPNEEDCLEFAKAKNPLQARDDFFLGIGYAKSNAVYQSTGQQISASDGLAMAQDHGLHGSNRERAINQSFNWR